MFGDERVTLKVCFIHLDLGGAMGVGRKIDAK
jgi:hypothetical protein